MTFDQMKEEVADACKAEGMDKPPSAERIERLLNRAKNEICGHIESLDENQFTNRLTYTVTAGDASITLPNGSNDPTSLGSNPIAFKRLLGLTRTDTAHNIDCIIINPEDRHSGYTETAQRGDQPILYREGNALYFDGESGAYEGMTLVLRYAGVPADITGSDDAGTTRYTLVPDEWTDLIVMRAVFMALPAGNGSAKWDRLYMDRLAQLLDHGNRQIADRIPHVMRDDGDEWWE